MSDKTPRSSMFLLCALALATMIACGPEASSGPVDDLDGWDPALSTQELNGEDAPDPAEGADDAHARRRPPLPEALRQLGPCRALQNEELFDDIRACGQQVRSCADGLDRGDHAERRACFEEGRGCALELGVIALPKPPIRHHRRGENGPDGDPAGGVNGPDGAGAGGDADPADRREPPTLDIPDDALCFIRPRPPHRRHERGDRGEGGGRAGHGGPNDG